MNKLYTFSLLLFILILPTLAIQNSIKVPGAYSGSVKPLYDEFPTASPLNSYMPDKIDTITPSFVKDTLMIDFEGREVTYSRFDTLTGIQLWQFHYPELTDYFNDMFKATEYNLWKSVLIEKGKKKKKKSDHLLQFSLPTHLPNWATRILGKEPPQLSITGSQTIRLGYKNSKHSVNGQEDSKNSSHSVFFEPNSDFLIKGSLGRLLKLQIRLSGKTGGDLFSDVGDQLNNIKIEYKEDSVGELEDDIIQEVVIGKTNFDMPGQGLAGYSTGSNKGLFGVKVKSKIGPLSLTTIASVEKVQTQKKTIDLNSTEHTVKNGESDYIRNMYFYLDEVYRLKYYAQFVDSTEYKNYLSSRGWTKAPEITTYNVYKKLNTDVKPNDPNNEYVWSKYKVYIKNGNSIDSTERVSLFQKLKENIDFSIDIEKGRIVFKNRLNDNDLIAIYLEDKDKQNIKGDLTVVYDSIKKVNAYKKLWVLKSERATAVQGDSTYNLMMRNVYPLSGNSSTPEFKITRKIGKDEYSEKNEQGVYFAKIMGLMDDNDNYLYSDKEIFDISNGNVIIPPYKNNGSDTAYSSVTAMYPFSNPELGETQGEINYGSIIYNDQATETWTDRFVMETVSKERMESFSLDFGVMQNSETLKANGVTPLEKNVDYTIDYGMGFVQLLSERAKSADKIDVEYQKESLFFLDRKVFIGINGIINFPTVGTNSYLGTTFMWQQMQSKSLTPKIGTEPFDRFLFDANLEFNFEPEWMTSFVNFIPLVSTDTKSKARFSVEVANSKIENSSKNNEDAYIDNFSTSSSNYSLGTTAHEWKESSPDFSWISSDNEFAYHPPAWKGYWYQPENNDEGVRNSQINPIIDDGNSNKTDSYLSILRVVMQPYPKSLELRKGIVNDTSLGVNVHSIVDPWVGITRGLNGNLRDRRNDRYLEFWVRDRSWKNGGIRRKGELVVDLGIISEDLSLNGKKPNGYGDYELVGEILTPEKDIGIDATKDEDEKFYYPDFRNGAPSWREMGYGDTLLGDYVNDPAKDNWEEYNKDNIERAPRNNGTSGNIIINKNPDNEDINRDGVVYTGSGGYFRYKIDLENIEESPYISKIDTANTPSEGWVKIRIPIGSNVTLNMVDSIVNKPSWDRIDQVRILWHGTDSTLVSNEGFTDTLEFYDMKFVGNQWREVITDSSDVGHVSASIEDSRNTSGYVMPPHKRIETVNGNTQVTDYTLVLDFNSVNADSTTVIARTFSTSQAMDFENYKTVHFWAEELQRQISTSRDIWFVYRFGNNDSTYYEFKTRRLLIDTANVYYDNGWESERGIELNLKEFTKLKEAWYEEHGEQVVGVDTAYANALGDTIRIFTKTEQLPSQTSIEWLGFGVANNSGSAYNGRIRLNGLSASGMPDKNGWAYRSNLEADFSDFIKSNVTLNYTDADFRSMGDDVHSNGNSSVNSGISGEIQLSKFIPSRVGIRLPFGATVSTKMDRPTVKPNSDVTLRNSEGKADGIADMVGDFGKLLFGKERTNSTTAAEEYEKSDKSYRIYTGYRKNTQSKNPLVNLTADRIGVDYSYSVTASKDRNGLIAKEDSIKVKGTTHYHLKSLDKNSSNFTLDYNLSPSSKAQKKVSWEPFKKSKKKKLPRKIKNTKFNLLPSTFTFNVIKLNYNWSEDYNSLYEMRDSNYTFEPQERLGVNHNVEYRWEPIAPFTSINLKANFNRDFNSFLKTWGNSGTTNFAKEGIFSLDPTWHKYGILKQENNRDFTSSFRLSPEFFNWLTTTATFSNNYKQNVDNVSQADNFMDANLSSNFRFNVTFRIRRVFDNMGKWGDKGFSKAMKSIAKAFDKINFESVDFNYNAQMGLSSSSMDTLYFNKRLQNPMGYYSYILGFKDRSFGDIVTGKMDDRNAFGGVQNRVDWYGDDEKLNISDSRKTSQNYTFRTGFKIPGAEISFSNISLSWNRNYSVYAVVGKMDTTLTWPQVKVNASTPILRKIPSLKDNFRSLNFSSAYNYSKKNSWYSTYFITPDSTAKPITKNLSVNYGLDPLFKIDGVLKKRAIDLSYSLGLLWDTTLTSEEKWLDSFGWNNKDKSGSKATTVKQSITGGYKIRGKRGRTIKLFKSRVVQIKGDTRFSLSINSKRVHHNMTDFTQGSDTDPNKNVQEWDDKSLAVNPRVEYDFTKNIKFSFYYNLVNSLTDPDKKKVHNGEVAGEITITF